MTDEDQVDVTSAESQVDELDDSAQTRPASEGMKDLWKTNPLLKVAAVVVGIGILAGAYLTFFGKGADLESKSVVGGVNSAATTVAGQGEVDAEYRKALEEANKQRADQAAKSGGSAMPTPIANSKSEAIDLPSTSVQDQEDPLREWRARNEPRQAAQPTDDIDVDQQAVAPQPEIVPMVQPVRPQVDQAVNPDAAKVLAEQMRVIVSAQKPEASLRLSITGETSPYIKRRNEKEKQVAVNGAVMTDGVAVKPEEQVANQNIKPKTIVPAGTIAYAQLLNELNSDVKGPVLAQILSGPFEGGRAIGSFEMRSEYLVLSFKRIVKQGVSYSIDGIALNEQTTLSAHKSEVNHHYLTRVFLPAAAKFIEGYGKAAAQTGTSSTTTAGGGVVQNQPKPDAREQLMKGVEESSKKMSEIVNKGAERPITVLVHRGTTMGILFMDTITTESAK